MAFVQNFPFFCIILSMFSAIISFVLNGRAAKYVHIAMVTAVLILSLATLSFVAGTGESYTFMMGHYPAPWGNEIRIGELEALMAAFFSLIMLLSVFGGMAHIDREVQNSKKNLFYILLDLLMASLLALIYTNDLFTAYVFIEINTISACGLIMIKKQGRTYVSAIRYMIMSLVGSGLFLIGLTLLYCITGHLLMSPAKEALAQIVAAHSYQVPLMVIIILITVGLGIKSGLYPFHTWIPDAYGYTTPASSAILSSLVSKGYIFLLIKIFYRVLDFDSIISSHMVNILFVFGLVGMIMGSVAAIKENNIRRMTAYSSVAQIGYIYMGIGLGTTAGIVAALFHVISHGAMKSLLFISISGLTEVSDGHSDFKSLKGAGFRNKIAGAAYTVGALSMIGMPLLTGFVSKYLFASAATTAENKMLAAWIVLAVSTILNTVYFMRTVLTIYTPVSAEMRKPHGMMPSRIETAATFGMILLNVGLGVASQPVIKAIEAGLAMFG
ncbi:MAG: complex I subunit 5 family protein [Coprococcus sp.]